MRPRSSGGNKSSGELAALVAPSSLWARGDLLRFRSLDGRFPLSFFVLSLDAMFADCGALDSVEVRAVATGMLRVNIIFECSGGMSRREIPRR
jgi:hypothetical protein